MMNKNNERDWINILGYTFLFFGIFILIGGYIIINSSFELTSLVNDLYANVGVEFVFLAITIIIVDRIVRYRDQQDDEEDTRKRLLQQIHSPVNSVAVAAAHELRGIGRQTGESAWVAGARLGGKADLSEARLLDANFRNTRLVGAKFVNADLRSVDFRGADLSGANLTGANITGAQFDTSTILPDGGSWASDTDLLTYGAISESSNLTETWVGVMYSNEIDIDFNDLESYPITAQNLISYLRQKFPNMQIAKHELHFLRHWDGLINYRYQTIAEVDDLVETTKHAKDWVRGEGFQTLSICSISHGLALNHVEYLDIPHWNEETRKRLRLARDKFKIK